MRHVYLRVRCVRLALWNETSMRPSCCVGARICHSDGCSRDASCAAAPSLGGPQETARQRCEVTSPVTASLTSVELCNYDDPQDTLCLSLIRDHGLGAARFTSEAATGSHAQFSHALSPPHCAYKAQQCQDMGMEQKPHVWMSVSAAEKFTG